MKRAILLLVVLVGGAFYLGWFTFTTDNAGHTEHVNIVINKDKIQQDEGRAVEKLHSLEQQAEEQAQTNGQALPAADRSADRRMQTLQQPIRPFDSQPPNAGTQDDIRLGTGTQPAGAASQEVDPYELPAKPRAANRRAAETGNESFSRGFQ